MNYAQTIQEAVKESVDATLALIEHLDGPNLFEGGETESQRRAEKRDMAYGRAMALRESAGLIRNLLWSERRDIVQSLLKALEDSSILLPTTNADIEFGKWLKEHEHDGD